MCIIGIFSAVPVARTVQQFIYETAGRELFTYSVLLVISSGLVIVLYFFIFKLKVKRVSQYIWLSICAGLYLYLTIKLSEHPEETIHFLEYGLLSYFLFKAFNHRIKDSTIYITVFLSVLFVGTVDEFLQWIMPRRYWDFRDIGFNTLAGGIFLSAVWKGINPKSIYGSAKKISAKILVGLITANLIFLGLCLSNTPGSVKSYTNAFKTLSWLKNEEPMTEFGYKHRDPEIGVFYSGLTLEELKEIDLARGKHYGHILSRDKSSDAIYKKSTDIYTPYTNLFLYEFLIHLLRRDRYFDELKQTDDPNKRIRISSIVFRENLLVEKYFGNTLKHSGFTLDDEKVEKIKETASLQKGAYISKAGRNFITSFNLKQALLVIFITLVVIWTFGVLWMRRTDE